MILIEPNTGMLKLWMKSGDHVHGFHLGFLYGQFPEIPRGERFDEFNDGEFGRKYKIV